MFDWSISFRPIIGPYRFDQSDIWYFGQYCAKLGVRSSWPGHLESVANRFKMTVHRALASTRGDTLGIGLLVGVLSSRVSMPVAMPQPNLLPSWGQFMTFVPHVPSRSTPCVPPRYSGGAVMSTMAHHCATTVPRWTSVSIAGAKSRSTHQPATPRNVLNYADSTYLWWLFRLRRGGAGHLIIPTLPTGPAWHLPRGLRDTDPGSTSTDLCVSAHCGTRTGV